MVGAFSISMAQALDIWSDLCDAYHGKGWGGDVAEIYMYRVMAENPAAAGAKYGRYAGGIWVAARDTQAANANAAVFDLLSHFASERDCSISVEGRDLGEWLASAGFDHRVHVKVTPKERT